jgi:alpha-beta hydrolase superfamily lysophospholipase
MDSSGAPSTAVVRRSSAQPTRRAVLHVQAPDDPAAPPELASWFTERAFHYYAAGLRLAPAAKLTARRAGRPVGRQAGRDLRDACADLDAACARVRGSDGITSVIVTAHGRAAVAAALWADSERSGADALILSAPAWPRGGLRLTIACPVLVITDDGSQAASRSRPRRARAPGVPPQLGSHVTWLTLADAGGDQRRLLEELGRWLGAYMYGAMRDQLL